MESRTIQLLEFPKVLRLLGNFALSEPGQRACLALAPLTDQESLAREAELFRQARSWLSEKGFRLSSFPDLAGVFLFLQRPHAILDKDGLWAVRGVLKQAKSVRDALKLGEDARTCRWPLLVEQLTGAPWPGKSWSALKRCLGDDGEIKDESTPELMAVREKIRSIHQQCTRRARDFILEQNLSAYLQDDFITISSDRYVLPLKTNFKGRFQGIIHDYSQTGETCYFEPMFLVEVNNALQELKQVEREAEKRLLMQLTGLLVSELDLLVAASAMLVALDLLQAKVAFADAYAAELIAFAPDAPLCLRQARHPLLQATAVSDEGKRKAAVIPIDLELAEQQRGIIISGSNAGGKTVCLKTLGLIAMMGLSGMPVPVQEGSTLPLWDKLFVFMGDEQSLEDHVSTFTAQITNFARVWDRIDNRTLVVLDEFGAGTDPSQGAALAQAVVEGLLERGAWVAVATHFPALKAYSLGRADVRSASVLFDPVSKRPLYRLGYDQVGLSQALDVAREHGLPEEIVRRAEQCLLLDGTDTSALVERLNALANAREEDLRQLNEERRRYEKRRATLDERYTREKQATLRELELLSQKIFHEWQAGRLAHKQALRELKAARAQLGREDGGELAPVTAYESLHPGQAVNYLPWKKRGVVEATDDKRQRVKIDMSGVSIWARPEELVPLDLGISPQETGKVGYAPEQTSLRLDVRGHDVESALSALSRFLDQALLGSISTLEIVHGRGAGILRREVHQFLSSFPGIQSYRLADEEQGGDGMTLVELA